MGQSVNLSIAGLYTAPNDLSGVPEGALDVADNIVINQKNLAESRRGFEEVTGSFQEISPTVRATDYLTVDGPGIVGLTAAGLIQALIAGTWEEFTGLNSGVKNPNDLDSKSRFTKFGSNLALTSKDSVRVMEQTTSEIRRAGVPKGLDLQATVTGDSGFLTSNIDTQTTGTTTSASENLTNLGDMTGITEGLFVAGDPIDASLVVAEATFTAIPAGSAGNSITIELIDPAAPSSPLSISVVGSAISVSLETNGGSSIITDYDALVLAINTDLSASLLVSGEVTGTGSTTVSPIASTSLAGGSDNPIPAGTTVSSITPSATVIAQSGNVTAGSTTITNLVSNAGILADQLVTGLGIPEGAKVVSISGAGPFSVVIDKIPFQTTASTTVTMTAPAIVVMDKAATASISDGPITFYSGAQVGYKMVFGRKSIAANGTETIMYGSPSSRAIAVNTLSHTVDTIVRGTVPKNQTLNTIQFVQLFRSPATDSVEISPLEQYQLVAERNLDATDLLNGYVQFTDQTPDSLKGLPLYTGTDREGATQANDPPPACWDFSVYRDMGLYANVIDLNRIRLAILASGPPNGVQVGDELTLVVTDNASPIATSVYTASSSESLSAKEFKVFTSGTPSQNVADTASSLIRVINFDQDVPVNAFLLSGQGDLPGQMLLEGTYNLESFSIQASAHGTAYSPDISSVTPSQKQILQNRIRVSKSGEFEAVPTLNELNAGDASTGIIRVIPLRDYAFVLKDGGGIYRITGSTPSDLAIAPFDLTTSILGSETAAGLNNAAYFMSNQGVVSVSDAGVEIKSMPIDDVMQALIQSENLTLRNISTGVGYESAKRYVVGFPSNSGDATCFQEYVYNYQTNTWTRFTRDIRSVFINAQDDRMYIIRGDENSISKERKNANYKDFIDEIFGVTIVSVDGLSVVLDDVAGIIAGDVLIQDSEQIFSIITAVDLESNTVFISAEIPFMPGSADIGPAIDCMIQWKPSVGDNVAFVRQCSEGTIIFRRTRFAVAEVSFFTDISGSAAPVPIVGKGSIGAWGLFPWGTVPWGGIQRPQQIRFYVPASKQMNSMITAIFTLRSAYSDFLLEGISLWFESVNKEVFK